MKQYVTRSGPLPDHIHHQGFAPKRSMLLVWENASPELPDRIATGCAPTYPVAM